MTLDLVAIAVMAGLALLYGALVPGRWRGWALLLGSVVALFWLQAPLAPRFADFLLPAATIALAVAGGHLTTTNRATMATMAPLSTARCGRRRRMRASAAKTRPTSSAVTATNRGDGGREAVRRKSPV